MANLNNYIGRDFGDCIFDILDDLKIPQCENELECAIDGLKKHGLYACAKTHIIKKIPVK